MMKFSGSSMLVALKIVKPRKFKSDKYFFYLVKSQYWLFITDCRKLVYINLYYLMC